LFDPEGCGNGEVHGSHSREHGYDYCLLWAVMTCIW